MFFARLKTIKFCILKLNRHLIVFLLSFEEWFCWKKHSGWYSATCLRGLNSLLIRREIVLLNIYLMID